MELKQVSTSCARETYLDEPLLRVEVRFKNARLYDAILAREVPVWGAKSPAGAAAQQRGRIKAFCVFHGVSVDVVYGLLNLTRGPLFCWRGNPRYVRVRPICQHLASLLEVDVAWLFPVALYAKTWQPLIGHLSEGELQSYLVSRFDRTFLGTGDGGHVPGVPSPADVVDQVALTAALKTALWTLSPREEKVLSYLYGIGDQPSLSKTEVAALCGVSPTRIGQIQDRALRKMRHPSRSRPLRGFLTA